MFVKIEINFFFSIDRSPSSIKDKKTIDLNLYASLNSMKVRLYVVFSSEPRRSSWNGKQISPGFIAVVESLLVFSKLWSKVKVVLLRLEKKNQKESRR